MPGGGGRGGGGGGGGTQRPVPRRLATLVTAGARIRPTPRTCKRASCRTGRVVCRELWRMDCGTFRPHTSSCKPAIINLRALLQGRLSVRQRPPAYVLRGYAYVLIRPSRPGGGVWGPLRCLCGRERAGPAWPTARASKLWFPAVVRPAICQRI